MAGTWYLYIDENLFVIAIHHSRVVNPTISDEELHHQQKEEVDLQW